MNGIMETLKLLVAIVISGLTVVYTSPLVFAAVNVLESVNRVFEGFP